MVIFCQAIELESCSNSLKDANSLIVSNFKKFVSFQYELLCDVTIGAGLGFLDWVIRPWAATAKGNFLFVIILRAGVRYIRTSISA